MSPELCSLEVVPAGRMQLRPPSLPRPEVQPRVARPTVQDQQYARTMPVHPGKPEADKPDAYLAGLERQARHRLNRLVRGERVNQRQRRVGDTSCSSKAWLNPSLKSCRRMEHP